MRPTARPPAHPAPARGPAASSVAVQCRPEPFFHPTQTGCPSDAPMHLSKTYRKHSGGPFFPRTFMSALPDCSKAVPQTHDFALIIISLGTTRVRFHACTTILFRVHGCLISSFRCCCPWCLTGRNEPPFHPTHPLHVGPIPGLRANLVLPARPCAPHWRTPVPPSFTPILTNASPCPPEKGMLAAGRTIARQALTCPPSPQLPYNHHTAPLVQCSALTCPSCTMSALTPTSPTWNSRAPIILIQACAQFIAISRPLGSVELAWM